MIQNCCDPWPDDHHAANWPAEAGLAVTNLAEHVADRISPDEWKGALWNLAVGTDWDRAALATVLSAVKRARAIAAEAETPF